MADEITQEQKEKFEAFVIELRQLQKKYGVLLYTEIKIREMEKPVEEKVEEKVEETEKTG